MVNQVSSGEHLQPFKEKIGEFLSEGVPVVVTTNDSITEAILGLWVRQMDH